MDPEGATSETPFLDKESLSDSFESTREVPLLRKAGWLQRNMLAILSNIIIIAICTTIGVIDHWYMGRYHCAPQSLVYTPARESLEYVRMEMDTAGDHHNKYMGATDTADEVWTELLSRNNIRLSDEDLRAINQTSVSLGSGGYLGMLAVYHELHCVKMIRWAFNHARYKSHWSPQDLIDLPDHVEHCLDIVRQSIQCRADSTIITYWWTEKSRVPETNFYGHHECINWDKFEAWADQHSVDIYVPGELNHPIYGQSYPNGHRLVEDGKVPVILPALEYEV
ncbi:hypothetical protein NA56DRAFT_305974 [Hyaloscypha hepaticicola]|uniref:Tat pathway signal sequence n=1 Tax=Hyaloscypha hepaticicola TaxID=2082293 RepID=A0A2J6PRI9_9HELO|nr:hypothetical protein NA56DRAFT_305974 [Hyaloscypha hepaticicola]